LASSPPAPPTGAPAPSLGASSPGPVGTDLVSPLIPLYVLSLFFFEILICKFVLPFGFNKYEYSFIKKKKQTSHINLSMILISDLPRSSLAFKLISRCYFFQNLVGVIVVRSS
jgi:hypothetical protein